MATDLDPGQLTALMALLQTARDLVADLANDGSAAKLMQAFHRLDPHEREVLATAFDRAVSWKKVNEGVAPITRVHLRVNPNPRLFVRVVEPDVEPHTLSPDLDELLVGTLRILRQAHLMQTPEARAVWEPAVVAALELLDREERAGCAAIVDRFVEILRAHGSESEPSGGDMPRQDDALRLPRKRGSADVETK